MSVIIHNYSKVALWTTTTNVSRGHSQKFLSRGIKHNCAFFTTTEGQNYSNWEGVRTASEVFFLVL